MFASGSEHAVSYVAESTYATTPGSPTMKALRTRDGVNLNMTKQTLTSQETRDDRQIVTERHGNQQSAGDLPFELSYSSQDDFIEAALMGTWAASVDLTATDISAANSDNSFNTVGAVDFSAFETGDEITVSGFTDPDNNGTFVIATKTSTKITVTGGTLADEAAGDSVQIVSSRQKVTAGKVNRSFTIERRFTDITQFFRYVGQRVNTFNLNIAPNAMVTGTFGMVGSGLTPSGTSLGTPTAAPTTEVLDSFTGVLKENDTEIAIVTGLDLSLDNGVNPLFVVGSKQVAETDRGRSNLTGSLTAYFPDATLLNKFVNETESSLYITLPDAAGNEIRINLPRIKYNGADIPQSGEGALVQTLPIRALRDATEGTNIVWERKPTTS